MRRGTTPAPEDVEAAIEQLSTRIDELSKAKRITELTKEVRGGN